jgi:integrase/recombinase XerD
VDKETKVRKYMINMSMKGFSAMTIRNYMYIINDFLEKYKIPNEKSVESYLMNKSNITKNSMATQVRILRSFGKFLQKELRTTFLLPEAPKTGKTLPVFLTKEEVNQIFLSASSDIRDLSILSFIIYTGVRVSELVNIKTEDINLTEKIAKIRGKGDKERYVPLTNELVMLISRYISEKKDNNEYLFLSKYKRKLTPLSVQLIVKKYASRAMLKKHITPHKLRHTFATLALETGVSPITISELLGHSSLNTTMKYTHVTNKLTEEAVRKIAELTNLSGMISEVWNKKDK